MVHRVSDVVNTLVGSAAFTMVASPGQTHLHAMSMGWLCGVALSSSVLASEIGKIIGQALVSSLSLSAPP